MIIKNKDDKINYLNHLTLIIVYLIKKYNTRLINNTFLKTLSITYFIFYQANKRKCKLYSLSFQQKNIFSLRTYFKENYLKLFILGSRINYFIENISNYSHFPYALYPLDFLLPLALSNFLPFALT